MKPHRTDGVSLSFGLIFLGIVSWWLVEQVTDVHLPALGWLAAGGLILLGVMGLGSAIRSGRRDDVAVPVQAEAKTPADDLPDTDLPPELHADIIRELLENPADRLPVEPVTAPPASAEPDTPQQRR
jgi:hypothetical protein